MRAAIIALLAATVLAAQPQDTRPAYEAASVKLNTSNSGSSSSHSTKGQVLMENISLRRLVERAYGVKPVQVTAPGWMDDVHFDIAGKFPPDSKDEDRNLMLRTLLEDRFKLAVHRETKDLPGWVLLVAKGGFKLKPVEPAGGADTSTNGGRVRTLTAKKATMATLADLITRNLGEMVVDKTALDGAYDFVLTWTTDDNPASTDVDSVPSLFGAIQETLGLRLQSQKIPMEIIVVDHAERLPIEN